MVYSEMIRSVLRLRRRDVFFANLSLRVILAHSRASTPEEEALFSDVDSSTEQRHRPAVEHHHHHPGHSHGQLVETKSLLRSAVLVVTLGIHTLFEGMAIGLIRQTDLLVTLSIAVMVHQTCCAIALGLNLAQQQITLRAAVVICVIFSLMMPAGIGFGLALGQITGFVGLLLTAILQGVATGTFIYVLFIEIIPAITCASNSLLQMLLMFAGCTFMTLIILLTDVHDDQSFVATNCTNASIS